MMTKSIVPDQAAFCLVEKTDKKGQIETVQYCTNVQ